jgi:hypothetical protein
MTTTEINGNDIHTILPKCIHVHDIITIKHYRKSIYIPAIIEDIRLLEYQQCYVKLDLIEDQGEEGTRRFQRLGSYPRHHQRDYQTIFESIKDYHANISLFHMTTAKRVLQYVICTVHFDSSSCAMAMTTATATAMQTTVFIIFGLQLDWELYHRP